PLVGAVMPDTAKTFLQMMRCTAGELAWRIHDIGKHQRIPRRHPLRAGIARRFEREREGRLPGMLAQLHIGIVGIGHMLYIAQDYAGFLQTIVNCMKGKLPYGKRDRTLTMLHSCKAFLLSRSNYNSISDQASGTIVKRGVN